MSKKKQYKRDHAMFGIRLPSGMRIIPRMTKKPDGTYEISNLESLQQLLRKNEKYDETSNKDETEEAEPNEME